MDLNKLSNGDRVIAVSGILLLIFSFFPWIEGTINSGPFEGASDTASAWGTVLGIIGVLIGVALVVIVLLPAFGVDVPAGLRGPKTVVILAAICFLAILLVALTSKMEFEGFPDDVVDNSRKIGAWLGLIASAGVLAGGILKWKEGPAAASSPPAAPPTAA